MCNVHQRSMASAIYIGHIYFTPLNWLPVKKRVDLNYTCSCYMDKNQVSQDTVQGYSTRRSQRRGLSLS